MLKLLFDWYISSSFVVDVRFVRLFVLFFFTEVTFLDGNLNGAENGSLPDHCAQRRKLSFNDREGRGHKINSSALF